MNSITLKKILKSNPSGAYSNNLNGRWIQYYKKSWKVYERRNGHIKNIYEGSSFSKAMKILMPDRRG
jgi:hypothetical protein